MWTVPPDRDEKLMPGGGTADAREVTSPPANASPTRSTLAAAGFRRSIEGGPAAAARARRELAALHSELGGPLLDSLHLLVTELVTNAVRHAAAPTVDLVVQLGSASVRVEVANAGAGFEAGPRSDHGSGWGLFLLDRLSERWGLDGRPGRQRVWFELRRD